MSDLHQIEYDHGHLIVHEVHAKIDGPTTVQNNQSCRWEADVSGGREPYTYRWQRDFDEVSTTYDYWGNSGTSGFSLTLQVTDADGVVVWDVVNVEVGYGDTCSI